MSWKISRTAGLLLAFLATPAQAELYINEIFFNPGGNIGDDLRDEYIELRGTPNMSLANHYLIFLENEDDEAGNGGVGSIDNVFNLGAFSMGSNGFLTIRQKNNRYAAPVAGTTDLVNTSPGPNSGLTGGYGSGAGSTVGAEDTTSTEGDPPQNGHVEGGGFTAMLLRADPFLLDDVLQPAVVPKIDPDGPDTFFDLDFGNDGLDPVDSSYLNWRKSWTILDSIGIHGEDSETQHGRLYGQVNFGPTFGFVPPGWQAKIEPGAEFHFTDFEIEFIARWGNSTGQTAADWHITNLTDNRGSGSSQVDSGIADWRQSCIDAAGCHPANDGNPNTPAPQPPGGVESNKAVPYGTKLTTTLGRPNYLTGDYDGSGEVDAADYVIWVHTVGQVGTETNHPAADANHDFLVNDTDYNSWSLMFGTPNAPSGGGSSSMSPTSTVPEPSGFLLALAGFGGFALRRVRRET